MPPHVVYWHKQPTPYMVERCNAIADRGSVDLEVWFNTRQEADRSWGVDETTWRFRAQYVRERRSLGVRHRIPIAELALTRPDVFVQEYDRAYLAAGFLVARHAAARTAFRVLPNYDRVSERTWWREASKHFLLRAVDGAKVSGRDGTEQARRYGLDPSRAWRTTQSIDIDHYARARSVAGEAGRMIREELGLRGTVFLYVGRLTWAKGIDVLLDAYERLSKAHDDVSLLIVGDGADERRYRDRAQTLPRVSFVGFVEKEEMPSYYAAADVMVFPTLGDANGLVVEEAMAAGVPVISSSSAGDIRERLPPAGPGLIVPTEDVSALASAMETLTLDSVLLARMAEATARQVEGQTIGRHAEDFERFILGVMAMPARSSRCARIARTAGRVVIGASQASQNAGQLLGKASQAVLSRLR